MTSTSAVRYLAFAPTRRTAANDANKHKAHRPQSQLPGLGFVGAAEAHSPPRVLALSFASKRGFPCLMLIIWLLTVCHPSKSFTTNRDWIVFLSSTLTVDFNHNATRQIGSKTALSKTSPLCSYETRNITSGHESLAASFTNFKSLACERGCGGAIVPLPLSVFLKLESNNMSSRFPAFHRFDPCS